MTVYCCSLLVPVGYGDRNTFSLLVVDFVVVALSSALDNGVYSIVL